MARARCVGRAAFGLSAVAVGVIILIVLMTCRESSSSAGLAPAIFVSFEQMPSGELVESRVLFHKPDGLGDPYVEVSDDGHDASALARSLSPEAYEYETSTGKVEFAGMEWELSGEEGNRTLSNTKTVRSNLWGTYYEDETTARAHPYVRE